MKKGFTLIELLGTIIVLGVISLITIGVVTNSVKTSRKKAFQVNAINLLDATKEYVAKEMDNNDFPEDGIEATSKLILTKNNPFKAGIVRRNEEGQIELENVTDGKYCANGVKSNLKITEGNCESADDTPPTLKLKELKTTRNETIIMIKTQDSGSGIKEYKYCIDDQCKTVDKKMNKGLIKDVVKIEQLDADKTYKIKVTSVNGTTNKNNTVTKTIEIRTKEIEEPQFKISTTTFATTKKLKIIYPEVSNEYSKKFIIKETNEINEALNQEIEIDVEENRTIRAYIEKDGKEIVYNEIQIVGIDQEGPKVNLIIPDIEKWSKTKEMTIEAIDEGIGLAIRPYINNGWDKEASVWNKIKTRTIDSSGKINVKVRDRLGNINTKFTINGTTECCTDCESLCAINRVDSVGPRVEIRVIEGTTIEKEEYKEWYNSDKVVVEIKLIDQYLYNKEKIDGGSGVNESTLKVKVNDEIVNTTRVRENVYRAEIKKSGENKIRVEIKDKVGNQGTGEKIVKIDNDTPIIKAKNNPLSLGNVDYKFVNNLDVTYGPTGGFAECDPAESRKTGTYTVTCKATGNNGRVASGDTGITFTTRHSYPAHSRQESYTYSCNPRKCIERYNCKVETGVSSVCVRYEHDQNGVNGVHCVEQVDTPWRHESCDEREMTCYSTCSGTRTVYYCNNDGSTLRGQTCYY